MTDEERLRALHNIHDGYVAVDLLRRWVRESAVWWDDDTLWFSEIRDDNLTADEAALLKGLAEP